MPENQHSWRQCTPSKVQEVFCGDMQMALVAVRAILRLSQSLLIFVQSNSDEEIAKLARRNALIFFEQALFMIKLVTEDDAISFVPMNALFWECYGSGPVVVPADALTLPRGKRIVFRENAYVYF